MNIGFCKQTFTPFWVIILATIHFCTLWFLCWNQELKLKILSIMKPINGTIINFALSGLSRTKFGGGVSKNTQHELKFKPWANYMYNGGKKTNVLIGYNLSRPWKLKFVILLVCKIEYTIYCDNKLVLAP